MACDTHKSQMTDVGNNELLSNEDIGALIGARTLLSKCVCVFNHGFCMQNVECGALELRFNTKTLLYIIYQYPAIISLCNSYFCCCVVVALPYGQSHSPPHPTYWSSNPTGKCLYCCSGSSSGASSYWITWKSLHLSRLSLDSASNLMNWDVSSMRHLDKSSNLKKKLEDLVADFGRVFGCYCHRYKILLLRKKNSLEPYENTGFRGVSFCFYS